MSAAIEISDDDDSIEAGANSSGDFVMLKDEPQKRPAIKSSEKKLSVDSNVTMISSDEEELPDVRVKAAKSNVIKKLFPMFPQGKYQSKIQATVPIDKPKNKGEVRMIGGVEVCLPVVPYGSQVALMAKVIEAMKKGKNCLLESPTGSGKTLALLCGALACQASEKERIAQIQAQQLVSCHPELESIDGVTKYCATPKKLQTMSPEELFQKSNVGTKSIYDGDAKASTSNGDSSVCKRHEPSSPNISEESPTDGLVQIHKKARLDVTEDESWQETFMQDDSFLQLTPEKHKVENGQKETPEHVRKLKNLVENLQLRTSMLVDCRAPKIFYGARTHKQLEQVIKEFGRTYYTGVANMTILSSREYSCIREFDRKLWGNKNEMCRGCTKAIKDDKTINRNKSETNCKHFDNRLALNRKTLPSCFDLEDLVNIGHELIACPYYAARILQSDADIVFCPYNYLIDPGIRKSLQIELADSVVVIDEAHNIEDICREAATFSITRDHIDTAIQELDVVKNYRFQNSDSMTFVEVIYRALRNMTDWFHNQMALINSQPVVGNEAVYKWQVAHFVQTLNNHNIGQQHYKEFQQSAEVFTRKLMEDPRALLGVSQATGSLVDNIAAALGYLFREDGKYMDDFKPALVKTLCMDGDNSNHWQRAQFNKSVSKESLSLRLLCLNPGIVFSSLKCAKSIILASGTLTPMLSFHSELATEFELKISPNHIIPKDRVWVGTLSKGPDGNDLTCTSKNTDQVITQDSIGDAILHVCQVTPNGVLCFLPSYALMNKLIKRWQQSGLWRKLNETKNVYQESRDVRDHNKIMEIFYDRVSTDKGCLLFAVYRGKVSEGMDFKDHQARAVITVGVPFPNSYDMPILEKKLYNNKYCKDRNLLTGDEWLNVQAYRALNQAVGRCVRHRLDWGAVLMIDSRFKNEHYTRHLSQWVRNFLESNHHTYESLVNSCNGLESFMQKMSLREAEDI